MLKKIVAVFLITTSPAALVAQQVELRSADGFVRIDGEIVGFDGTDLSVQTSVGVVDVVASSVGCYGSGCLSVLGDPSLGLSADNFREVVISDDGSFVAAVPEAEPEPEPESAPEPAPAPEVAATPQADDLVIGFEKPEFADLLRGLFGSYALSIEDDRQIDLTNGDQVELVHNNGRETAMLRIGDTGQGDVVIVGQSLIGVADAEYENPADWSLTGQLTQQMLALQSYSVVVAEGVGVTSIAMDDLAGIFAGEIDNWSALGGADLRILPLQLPVGSAGRDEVTSMLMEPLRKTIASNVLTLADEASIVSSVTQFPGSIAVVSSAAVTDKPVVPVAGACGVAVAPDAFNLASGDYPLVRPVMAAFGEPASTTLVRDLFDFGASNGALTVATDAGFVDLRTTVQGSQSTAERLQAIQASVPDMFALLSGAERLSPTLIGGAISGAEGGWNRAMFQTLSDTLASGEYDGREVYFVGFAQSENGEQVALDASVQAANDLRAVFGIFANDTVTSNNLTLSSAGFGAVSQATCYDNQVIQDSNIRIEIWVR